MPKVRRKQIPALKPLGDVIRAERGRLSLSQEGLALEAEINRTYMGGPERGQENVSVLTLIKISQALGAKPSTLLSKAGL